MRPNNEDIPEVSTIQWRNPTDDVVSVLVGHGEGARGRPSGRIVVKPKATVEIDAKYARAIPFLAPQLVRVDERVDEEIPVIPSKTAASASASTTKTQQQQAAR